jgi:hypothetical protein
VRIALPSSCSAPAAGGGWLSARATRHRVPVVVPDGRIRAGAEQRGHYVGVAVFGSEVQRRPPTAGDGNTGRRHWPAPTRHRFGPAPTRRTKDPPDEAVVVLDVQRCAGVDERIDGRQMAVFRRMVQRRLAIPVRCKGGGGVGVAQRATPTRVAGTHPVTGLQPRRYPGFLLMF